MDATLFLGIDVGSTTVKVAILDSDNNVLFSDYERHFANIRETLLDLMTKARAELGDRDLHPMITGSGGMSISKYHSCSFCSGSYLRIHCPWTISRRQTDVAIELGGEDAKIIYFTGRQCGTAYERYLCRRYRFFYRPDGQSFLRPMPRD